MTSSLTPGAQSGDHYCWRHSGCSIQGPWHMESCTSVRNSGLWPGGFVLCGLWGQWGASTRTFTKHEVNERWRVQNQLLCLCFFGFWFIYFFIIIIFPFLNQHRVTFIVILMVYYFVVFRSDFLSLPFQAIECSLAGVRPAGKKWLSGIFQWNNISFINRIKLKLYLYFGFRRGLDWGSPGWLWTHDILCWMETFTSQTVQLFSFWDLVLAQCETLWQQPGKG